LRGGGVEKRKSDRFFNLAGTFPIFYIFRLRKLQRFEEIGSFFVQIFHLHAANENIKDIYGNAASGSPLLCGHYRKCLAIF
jgi:hypothetical protein